MWRNSLDFKPLEAYGGHSYYDVLVSPVADAIRTFQASNTGIKAYLTLQGETGVYLWWGGGEGDHCWWVEGWNLFAGLQGTSTAAVTESLHD